MPVGTATDIKERFGRSAVSIVANFAMLGGGWNGEATPIMPTSPQNRPRLLQICKLRANRSGGNSPIRRGYILIVAKFATIGHPRRTPDWSHRPEVGRFCRLKSAPKPHQTAQYIKEKPWRPATFKFCNAGRRRNGRWAATEPRQTSRKETAAGKVRVFSLAGLL